ncbi:FtsX-like permease family protein [Streptomyces californicus]
MLLLVLSVAMGMLAIGQSASWDRSQSDQADFASGASVRMAAGTGSGPATAGAYSSLPGVRQAAPAYRADVEVAGGRMAEIVALDTAHADERMLMRADLSATSPRRLFETIAPEPAPRPGLVLPKGSTRRAGPPDRHGGAEGGDRGPGRGAAGGHRAPGGPLRPPLPRPGRPGARGRRTRRGVRTGVGERRPGRDRREVDADPPWDRARQQRLSMSDVRVVTGSGAERPVAASGAVRWDATTAFTEAAEVRPGARPVRNGTSGLPDFT